MSKTAKVNVEISYMFDLRVELDDDAEVCSALDTVYAMQTADIREQGKLTNCEILYAEFEAWDEM